MEDDIEIDPEVWLQYLMAVLPDSEEREKILQKISAVSGVSPDKVEQILQALTEYLVKETRQN